MKKLLFLVAIIATAFVSSCDKFDDSEIWNKLENHENRISALEELCKQLNTNINALQTIVNALEKNDYITNVSPIRKDGEIIGYTITFAHSDTITIYNGADGKDGADGYTPQIGVMKDTDGIYYWTVDGEWLLDAKGNKIKAVGQDGKDGQDGVDGEDGKDGQNGTNGTDGEDGKDGQDGADGKDGQDGADGVTPRLMIENGYWYISYDDGKSWEQLGKATGEDGADGVDGSDGADGDSIFTSVTQDDEYVYFNLSDGTMITLPKHDKENIQFEDLNVKAICCKHWDTNYDGELSYEEAAAVTKIGTVFNGNDNIIAFSELQYFTGLTIIPNNAFYSCTYLWKITIPKNVKKIGSEATSNTNTFKDCINLTFLDLPEGLNSIGDHAFSDCKGLVNITIPGSVTIIGENAFWDCASLKKIIIPDNVAIIGASAFYGCSGLEYMYIGSGVAEFGYAPFSGCTGVLVCHSPISSEVFEKSNFRQATFGGRCVKLSESAFCADYCKTDSSASAHSTIKTIILEESVNVIGAYAVNTSSLEYVYCKSTTPPQGANTMFYSGVKKIYVPIGSAEAYKTASYWKNYASKIEEYDFENNPIE